MTEDTVSIRELQKQFLELAESHKKLQSQLNELVLHVERIAEHCITIAKKASSHGRND